MDSLGGILTKGLLGNPILAQFNLFFFSVVITEPQTPPSGSGGASWNGPLPRGAGEEDERVKTVTIAIKFKTKEYKNTYELNEKKLRITINILNILTRTVNVFRNISLKFKKNRD